MNISLKNYELFFLIADLKENSKSMIFFESLKNFLKEKGSILNEQYFDKFNLAYPLKNKVTAYPISIIFQTSSEGILKYREFIQLKLKSEPFLLREMHFLNRKGKKLKRH